MLTALSLTAGAVIKKGFLLLLCLPDFLNLQPLRVCVSEFVRECSSACIDGQMFFLTYTIIFLMPFPKHIYNGYKTLFFSSLADNPNVPCSTYQPSKRNSDKLKVNTVTYIGEHEQPGFFKHASLAIPCSEFNCKAKTHHL